MDRAVATGPTAISPESIEFSAEFMNAIPPALARDGAAAMIASINATRPVSTRKASTRDVSTNDIWIGPSILSADFRRLGEQIADVEAAGADFIHVDVMDGVFVPNISIGLPVLEAVRASTQLPIDVHLMIVEPGRWVERFAAAGADVITVHVEVDPNLYRTLRAIEEAGATPSVTLNPGTPIVMLEPVIPIVRQVLIMSVNPGFGGQTFIPASMKRIRDARAMIESINPTCRLEVDGGVKASNAAQLVAAGADTLVAGSAVYAPDTEIARAMRDLRAAVGRNE